MKTIKYFFFVSSWHLLQDAIRRMTEIRRNISLQDSDSLDDLDYRLYSLVLDKLFPDADNLVVHQEVRSGSACTYHADIQAAETAVS